MSKTSSSNPAVPSPAKSPAHRSPLALLVAGTFFMENLDATIITPALPAMARSFGAQPADLNLGVAVYALTVAIFIPASGWIAERYGARRVFGLAIAMFTLASVLCGITETLWQFVAARALQGMAGSLMVPVGRLAVLRGTEKRDLVTVIATLTWPALVAPVLGPPLGGLLVDHAHWSWIFLLNVPLGIVALAMVHRVVPHIAPDPARRFDAAGFAFMGLALAALVGAAEAVSHSFDDWPPALAAFALSGLFAGLGVRHLRRARHPLFRLDVLGIATFLASIRGGTLFRMGVSAVPFLVPVMMQIGFGYSPFHSGLMLMAVFAGNVLIKPATTPLLARFGFRPILVAGGIGNGVALAACALFGPGTPAPVIAAVLFVGGALRSVQFTAINTLSFSEVPQSHMADANTMASTFTPVAMGLGVTLGAVAWRMGEALSSGGAAATPFRIAFVVVGVVTALATLDFARLDRSAGAEVASRGKARA